MSYFYSKECIDENTDNEPFALLKLSISNQYPELRELYVKHIELHNKKTKEDLFPNSGFDLFVPDDTIFGKEFEMKMIDHKFTCEMLYYDMIHLNELDNCGFFMFPRSSLSKTPLMLANHTGIIDSGYRGNIMAAFRSFQPGYLVEKHTRLLQICHPSLCKIFVVMVGENDLSNTSRGDGGFGSTGLKGI